MEKLKRRKMNDAGAIYIGELLAIAAILIASIALGYTIMKSPEKGAQGIAGVQGEQGDTGPIGPQGPAGDTGMTGPRGLNGTRGVNGTAGPRGANGTSYVNHAPTFNITLLSGDWTYVGNDTNFEFDITVVAHDLDNDTVQTTVYYRRNTTDVWTPTNIFWDKNVSVTTGVAWSVSVPSSQRIYWSVQSWDGCELTMKTYTYQVAFP